MKAQTILTVIGGGSVNWMPGLMRDFYRIPEITGGEIRLVDPNHEHTEAVAELLERYNLEQNKEYRISIFENRKEALRGAQFVLFTFSPGAMDAFENDLEIPIKYGLRQPVSMTVGPCGISASLRTAPIAAEIAEEMEEVCPGAWLINETNPMSVVTAAIFKNARTIKAIGLCHGMHEMHDILGRGLDLPLPEGMSALEYSYEWLPKQGFEYSIAGLNHFIFLNRAIYKGRNVLPEIRAYCQKCSAQESPEKEEAWETGNATASFAMTYHIDRVVCAQTGFYPINGGRHTIEFWPGLCNLLNGFGMAYGVKKTTVDERRLMKVQQLESIRKMARGEEKIPWHEPVNEEFSTIIRAVTLGESTRTVINAPNTGQISNLPKGSIVETLGSVDRDGLHPDQAGELPGIPGAWCNLHSQVNELALAAALEGSRELFIEALSLDPLAGTMDFSRIPELADDLISANQVWLPRFA